MKSFAITGIPVNYILKYKNRNLLFSIVIIFHNITVLLHFGTNNCSLSEHKRLFFYIKKSYQPETFEW